MSSENGAGRKREVKGRATCFVRVPNLDFRRTPVTLREHFRPGGGTLGERFFRQVVAFGVVSSSRRVSLPSAASGNVCAI
jgi:hypothetical protein